MAESTVNKVIQPFGGGGNPSSYALFRDFIKSFFESIKALFTTSWIIASLGQVAHFTSVVIRYVLAISAFRFASAYAKSASWIIRVRIAFAFSLLIFVTLKLALKQGYLLRRVSL